MLESLDNFSPNQVNNAGCMVLERELTEDGLETNFATNTLGRSSLAEPGGGEGRERKGKERKRK